MGCPGAQDKKGMALKVCEGCNFGEYRGGSEVELKETPHLNPLPEGERRQESRKMAEKDWWVDEDERGREAVKVCYLDASALVKLFVDEDGCQTLRNYFNTNANFCTTSLCFVEALGVLKRRYFYESKDNGTEYLKKCRDLVNKGWGGRIEIEEVRITKRDSIDERIKQVDFFNEAERLVGKYKIDFVDALQVLTILRGKYYFFTQGSKSILITADEGLARAARGENARVWNILDGKTGPS